MNRKKIVIDIPHGTDDHLLMESFENVGVCGFKIVQTKRPGIVAFAEVMLWPNDEAAKKRIANIAIICSNSCHIEIAEPAMYRLTPRAKRLILNVVAPYYFGYRDCLLKKGVVA